MPSTRKAIARLGYQARESGCTISVVCASGGSSAQEMKDARYRCAVTTRALVITDSPGGAAAARKAIATKTVGPAGVTGGTVYVTLQ